MTAEKHRTCCGSFVVNFEKVPPSTVLQAYESKLKIEKYMKKIYTDSAIFFYLVNFVQIL